MARKFFYVCAGVFLLALSYQLGARNASAQGDGNPVAACSSVSGELVTANGDFYAVGGSQYGLMMNVCVSSGHPLRSGDRFVAMAAGRRVVTAFGDWYESLDGSRFVYGGNVFGSSPVPVESSSWGAVKAKYR